MSYKDKNALLTATTEIIELLESAEGKLYAAGMGTLAEQVSPIINTLDRQREELVEEVKDMEDRMAKDRDEDLAALERYCRGQGIGY